LSLEGSAQQGSQPPHCTPKEVSQLLPCSNKHQAYLDDNQDEIMYSKAARRFPTLRIIHASGNAQNSFRPFDRRIVIAVRPACIADILPDNAGDPTPTIAENTEPIRCDSQSRGLGFGRLLMRRHYSSRASQAIKEAMERPKRPAGASSLKNKRGKTIDKTFKLPRPL